MIIEKARKTIKDYQLIKKGDNLVVGVSGGPDSVALLYLLDALRKEFSLKLHIAHLDHGLRPSSRRDREFVERLAAKLNIPFSSARVNIGAIAKKGSLEEIARNARLGFFFRVAKEQKARKIALGHNLDDQAETVLMRILRGTGLYGLGAMLPKKEIAGFQLIRPLLEIRRKEISAFLRKNKIRPLFDETNAQDIYFRNKIRNKLMPLLEKQYNSNIKGVLANLAQSAGADYDYLEQIARSQAGKNKDKLALIKLSKLHPAIQRLLIRGAIAGIRGDTRRITFTHLKEIEGLIFERPVNSVVDLPGGISVRKTKKILSFYRR
ncbi:MAG: tRNA lysidine(34) synthetase TilS [Candidatus Omnitrophota bacterium]